ncbi:MAG TPA: carboxypeptidase regulatory-like domain-containing protein [Gemmatimonadaceae bacterium]|nr:carboxypeptidase regulatory-like domain-containing protein [Gemmatimonadaceae bacterium]HET7622130.1 carboxypeptidase regulatory-like domain-containing protein [Gemmatimonadaceae bacterium]
MPRWIFLIGIALAPVKSLAAQQPQRVDIIRGRVTGPDSQPVFGAYIVVRRSNSRETREATTNENGMYTVLFPGSAGDYVVTARFILMEPGSVRVVRTGDEQVLTANLTLSLMDDAQLDSVTVTARKRPRPPRTGGASSVDDGPTGGESDVRPPWDEFESQFDPRRYSVLGADASENSLSVNGADVQAVLPNAVGMRGGMTSTTADASVGGFSGGHIAAQVGGAEQYHLRYLSASLSPAALKWVDRASADAGARSSTLNATLWTSDPLFDGAAHLTSVLTYGRSTTPLPEFPTTPAGLARLGLAADSLDRFLGIISQAGIPATVEAMPGHQSTTRLAWMGHLDLGNNDSETRISFDANLGTAGTGGAFTSPSALPSYGGHTRVTSGFLTAAFSRYIGNNFLTDLSTTANIYDSQVSPYLALPEARVRVFSELPSGDSALTWLTFGGNPSSGHSRTFTWQAHASTTWLSFDGKQRHRVGGELFTERLWQDPMNGERGTFEFESLEALEDGRASRFTRRTPAAAQRARGIRGALYVENRWTPSKELTLQYGLRLDLARIAAPTGYNPAIDSLFGRRTDVLPRLASVSPRLGIAWKWERPFDKEYPSRSTNGWLSLIFGRFQSRLGAGTALTASQATGLPSAARLLDCAGDAVPAPEWLEYGDDPANIPGSCTDGSGGAPVTGAVPSVTLFDRYRPPSQWRAALTWHNITWSELYVTLIHSRGTKLGGAIDLNLQPSPSFVLPGEADRPVYVAASAIATTTGATALGASRRSPLFGPVLATTSDLHVVATQLRVGKGFFKGKKFNFYAQYLYQRGREQSRGFGGLTAGDPLAVVWGPLTAPRHTLSVYANMNFSQKVRLVARGTLMSGMRYTPRVAGDVNGDGASNDIAFIPSPSSPLGQSMAAALRGAPAAARRCVARQAGGMAARNSCTGPWSSTLDLRLELSPSWLPNASGINIDIFNAAGGLDRLLHGTAHARGWGDVRLPDPTLLVATAFDPAAREFSYQVNPRFGRRPGGTAWHRPVQLRVSVRMPIGPSLRTQQNRTLARRARESRDDAEARARVLPVGSPFAAILRMSEKLRLGPDQVDGLRVMEGHWRKAIDSTQAKLTAYIEQLSDTVPDSEIAARVRKARERAQSTTDAWLPQIRKLLTEAQLDLLPRYWKVRLTGGATSGVAPLEP